MRAVCYNPIELAVALLAAQGQGRGMARHDIGFLLGEGG